MRNYQGKNAWTFFTRINIFLLKVALKLTCQYFFFVYERSLQIYSYKVEIMNSHTSILIIDHQKCSKMSYLSVSRVC